MDQFEAPRALVVFESMFGNTEAVAKAIAEGLSDHVSTTIEDVVTARPHPDNVDLLVVGAPTHAFGLSWRQTRMSAASQGARAPQSELIGLREWLEALVPPSRRVVSAAFDTRTRRLWVPGSAARAARRRLRRLGFVTSAKPKSFYVTGTPGPLADGELQRARAWGQHLGAAYAVARDAAAAV